MHITRRLPGNNESGSRRSHTFEVTIVQAYSWPWDELALLSRLAFMRRNRSSASISLRQCGGTGGNTTIMPPKLGTLGVKSYRRVVLDVRTYACWVVKCQASLNPVDGNPPPSSTV